MENMVIPENENPSSTFEENKTMKEEETKPEVGLTENGTIQDAPREITSIEIPVSDIREGISDGEDQTSLPVAAEESIAEIENTVASNDEKSETIEEPEFTGVMDTIAVMASPEAEMVADVISPEELPAEIEAGSDAQIQEIMEEVRENTSSTVEVYEQTTPESALEVSEVKDMVELTNELLADEEEGHEEEHLHDDEDSFEGMSREQLLQFVQEVATQTDGRNMNKKVQMARAEFNRLIRDDRTEALENWKTEGNEESAFVPADEPLLQEFNLAFKAYKKSRLEYVANLNNQKDQNLIAKKEVLEKLKSLTESNENVSSFNDFKKLQDEWRKIGHVPIADAENIWNNYNFYVNKFYEQRSLYSEFKELDSKRNLTAKEELIGRIEALDNLEDVNESMRLLKIYQDEWKHIGPVPKDILEDVLTRYKNAIIKLYEKKEKLSEELNARREQNYEAKLALIEKIEEIGAYQSTRVQDWINKNQELSQWVENWRSIGSIPISKGNELKERYAEALRNFNKNKNDFFRLRKREKVDNLRTKTELCEKVEALLTSETAAVHKKEVIMLQDAWKKSGPVPLKYSEKLWKRFQAACDAFFARIIEQHSDKDKEQFENLRMKNEIITAIEALLEAETVEAPEQQIRAFQEDFNHIGFVPFKEKDKIRKRFYDALNKLIAKVGSKPNTGGSRNENLGYKLTVQSWGQEPGAHVRLEQEEKKHSRELKRIENEISTLENNIEFFRNSKNADDLRANMDKQINELKEKMHELQDKIKMIRQAGRNQQN